MGPLCFTQRTFNWKPKLVFATLYFELDPLPIIGLTTKNSVSIFPPQVLLSYFPSFNLKTGLRSGGNNIRWQVRGGGFCRFEDFFFNFLFYIESPWGLERSHKNVTAYYSNLNLIKNTFCMLWDFFFYITFLFYFPNISNWMIYRNVSPLALFIPLISWLNCKVREDAHNFLILVVGPLWGGGG